MGAQKRATTQRPVVLKFQTVVGFDASEIAQRIKHPNVVQVLDAKTLGDKQCLVLEYVQGCTLQALLDHRTSSPKHTTAGLYIIDQMLEGLEHAHAQHLGVHRELLPEHVLLGRDGSVKLLNLSTSGRYVPERVQSPCYFSPEQLRGEKVTTVSNVFSSAAMLLELLTGEVVFDGSTDAMVRQAVLQDSDRAITPKLKLDSPPLSRALTRALKREPGDRYQRPSHFAEALKQPGVQSTDRRGARSLLIELVESICASGAQGT